MRYTVFRNLVGDADKKPDGLLLSSTAPISPDTALSLFHNSIVRELLPEKPAALIYYHVFNEYQVAITCNSYNVPTLNQDATKFDTHVWYEGVRGGAVNTLDYTKLYEQCVAEHGGRVGDEKYCPVAGLECITRLLGARPWVMQFNYTRGMLPENTGLTDTGTVFAWDQRTEEYGLRGGTFEQLVHKLSDTPISGFTFMHPDQTRTTNENRYLRLLRPRREHRFFETSFRKYPYDTE